MTTMTTENIRKKKTDTLTLLFNILSGTGWFLLLVALVVIGTAKPETTGTVFGFHVYRNARSYWRMELAEYALYLLATVLLCGLAGLILNSRRLKRKGDFVRISLILQTIVAMTGIGLYWKFLGL